ncbi:SAM-dependent methyltransferase [Corallococcus sp. H22C18031201]|uniref:SAM-dependent methyltransferase n=1 Tax=Citreicoccus inhibens TaxID=2849499 RepID=UPI000E733072|nr:class I SAM-dependent methyltransferase [Citreicoccus inhibens]MBU8899972.1 class I SAM-dependent methyltransferase [Citreicoccus inhibens]RJS27915.1 SAM-dependent methyltransferase [Corallococcus sp. H22C18031201]
MATATDLDFTYSQIDRIFRLSIGEMADFSGARYDGDFSLSLEEAQHRKHEFIAENLGITSGSRVLDLGCGWGPFLRFAESRGAHATGVTLSRGQAESCQRHGLDVHLRDCRTITRDSFGGFDAVVSLGAFEHFCSIDEYRQGRQEAIYSQLFASVRELLPTGGRFYLQTMVFGPKMLPYEAIDLHAPRGSDAHVLGLMTAQFPGSWLPYGREQLERTFAPFFRLVSATSGRLDYIETIRQWRQRFSEFSLPKFAVKLTLLPRYLLSRQFRNAFASGISANSVCFERHLFDHYRMVLEAV